MHRPFFLNWLALFVNLVDKNDPPRKVRKKLENFKVFFWCIFEFIRKHTIFRIFYKIKKKDFKIWRFFELCLRFSQLRCSLFKCNISSRDSFSFFFRLLSAFCICCAFIAIVRNVFSVSCSLSITKQILEILKNFRKP